MHSFVCKMNGINIREARVSDVSDIMYLIQELALFEKAPNEVSNTIEQMKEDGFSLNKIFDCFVAEFQGKIIGTAITYYRYSTWKGKCLYLEDLIVTEEYRGQGAGKLLFNHCLDFGRTQNCIRMNWQVLDWNEPAIAFYKSYQARLDGEWINASIEL